MEENIYFKKIKLIRKIIALAVVFQCFELKNSSMLYLFSIYFLVTIVFISFTKEEFREKFKIKKIYFLIISIFLTLLFSSFYFLKLK